jgi:hypothetical protein
MHILNTMLTETPPPLPCIRESTSDKRTNASAQALNSTFLVSSDWFLATQHNIGSLKTAHNPRIPRNPPRWSKGTISETIIKHEPATAPPPKPATAEGCLERDRVSRHGCVLRAATSQDMVRAAPASAEPSVKNNSEPSITGFRPNAYMRIDVSMTENP